MSGTLSSALGSPSRLSGDGTCFLPCPSRSFVNAECERVFRRPGRRQRGQSPALAGDLGWPSVLYQCVIMGFKVYKAFPCPRSYWLRVLALL